MSMTYNPYNFEISMKWNAGGDVIDIPDTNIASVIIDYDYDNKNMPLILVNCNISTKLIDQMVRRKMETTVLFNIKKYPIKTNKEIEAEPIRVKTDYLNGEFIYFLQDDVDYNRDVSYDDNHPNDLPEHLYVKTTIGLLDQNLVNSNKKLINYIYRNVTKTDIILMNTSHMPLLLEPLDRDRSYSEFIIPPISSLSALLKYMDDKHMIYATPYRFFIDFDKTYIMSSLGNNIQAVDETIKNIIFNIDNPVEMYSKIQGVKVEGDTHIVEVDSNYTKYYIDTTTGNRYNSILGIDSYGNSTSKKINILKQRGGNTKINIVRLEDTDIIDTLKGRLELSSVILHIVKNDIDCSIYTINKEYYVNNFIDYKDYNGLYLLSRKQEIFIKEHEYFRSNNRIILRKRP